MSTNAQVDVAILGGGVAGLWLLDYLHAQGYSSVLCEGHALGRGQTIASQGIIHGGTKYSLGGTLSGASDAIREMPRRWREAMEGSAGPDLGAARTLASHQLLWTTESIGSRLTGFFASKAMRARMQELARDDHPPPFDHRDFEGALYQLDEPVLDPRSVLEALSAPHHERLLHIAPESTEWQTDDDGVVLHLHSPAGDHALRLHARRLLLTAGAGNEALAQALPEGAAPMQRRPLHMVMLRGPLPPIYAHCLGVGANPRLTITSHEDPDGRPVWYIGGQLAEAGVGRGPEAQIAEARIELTQLLPWVNMGPMQWSTLRVDRAEGRQPHGHRPDLPVIDWSGPVAVAWPTKLAFAPRLAETVLAGLGIEPSGGPAELPGPGEWPRPPLAPRPWDEADRHWI